MHQTIVEACTQNYAINWSPSTICNNYFSPLKIGSQYTIVTLYHNITNLSRMNLSQIYKWFEVIKIIIALRYGETNTIFHTSAFFSLTRSSILFIQWETYPWPSHLLEQIPTQKTLTHQKPQENTIGKTHRIIWVHAHLRNFTYMIFEFNEGK